MRGVVLNDQFNYSVRYKSHKFYKYIFWFLFELVVTNAFILFRKHINPEETMRDFSECLATDLISNYCSRRQPGRVRRELRVQAPAQNHYPKKIETDNKRKARRCHHCALRGIRRETTWQCWECNLPLCHTEG